MKLEGDAENGGPSHYVSYEVRQESESYAPAEAVQSLGPMILEQDRFLPIANISRIMKKALPSSGKLSKEAKECLQECVTEFLLFITSEASEKCAMEKRKTITGEDLLTAFQTLGFDDYVDPLRDYLTKYREANKIHSSKSDENAATTSRTNATASTAPSNPIATTVMSPSSTSGAFHVTTGAVTTEPLRLSPAKELHQTQKPAPSAPTPASTGSLQPMQMFYDPSTGQHYIAVQTSEGSQSLMPVHLTAATQDLAAVANGEGPRLDTEHKAQVTTNSVYYNPS